VDRARQFLTIALVFCAIGAEIPREVLIRAQNQALVTQPVAAQHVAQPASAQQGSQPTAIAKGDLGRLTSLPTQAGETYWYFKAAAENAAVISRRDRVVTPLYDRWAGDLCCAAHVDRGSDGSAATSGSNCHRSDSPVVVGCRVIPLRI